MISMAGSSMQGALGASATQCTLREVLAEGRDYLRKLAETIDMPMIAWKPDIAFPYQFDELYDFHKGQGWPDVVLDRAWKPHALPCITHIKSRFTNFPFATCKKRAPRRPREANISKFELDFVRSCDDVGLNSVISVPMHCVGGRVGVLNFGGVKSLKEANETISNFQEQLIIGGQFLANYWKKYVQLNELQSELSVWLTRREQECLQGLAEGMREPQIASAFEIAPTTVRYHLDNVVEKLSANNRNHAIALAAQMGLLKPISAK